jgi:NADH dehydrogenase
MPGPMQLHNGSRIAVVGGGPAGSFFALYIRLFGEIAGVRPQITIYQDRHFDDLGVKGCKGCAGVLSLSLLRNWTELGLTIPDDIVRTRIDRYAVHSPYTSITISNPEKDSQIISVYRGGGPRLSEFESKVSFDGWLLSQAQTHGADVQYQKVSSIALGREPAIEVAGNKINCDLIVLANGASHPIPITGLGYIPPETRMMAQDELYVGDDEVRERLGTAAHAFLIPHSEIIFGTLVPKGPFVNVSVLSGGKRPVSVDEFLDHDMVRQVLPKEYRRSCGCRPKAVIGCATNYYADGFLAVGDSVASRLYKDGVGTALVTARQAARTVVEKGFSAADFQRHYAPLCHQITRDNRWGELLFSINKIAKNSRTFLLAQHRLVSDEQNDHSNAQPLTKAAWGMFTGSYSYRSIARMALNPASVVKLAGVLIKDSQRNLNRAKSQQPRQLYVGRRKVLILGSGFGGTYTLKNLVRSLNKNENVETTMVSNENFFLFSPLLHEVAMGGIETRHIAYPIRRLHWRDRFSFVQAEIERIDMPEHKVITSAGVLSYDYLVIALGSVSLLPEFGRAVQNTVFTLKTLHDSMVLRNHVISVFEEASREEDSAERRRLLTFVVSGAGYTGIQVIMELSDFIHRTLTRFYKAVPAGDIRILLVETEPKIVADLHTKLGAYAMKQIKRVGIEVRLKSHVTRISEGGIEINNRENIATNTLIWVAGVTANPRVAELSVPRDRIGRVLVDKYLQLPDFPGVYVIGDCASFRDDETGQPIPPRAHTAVRQARVAAKNILAEIRGYEKAPYRYSRSSEIVSLGGSRAVFRFHNIRIYGFAAKLVWLAAYTVLVTGAYNRLRITNDWILTRMFGRDTTFLKL